MSKAGGSVAVSRNSLGMEVCLSMVLAAISTASDRPQRMPEGHTWSVDRTAKRADNGRRNVDAEKIIRNYCKFIGLINYSHSTYAHLNRQGVPAVKFTENSNLLCYLPGIHTAVYRTTAHRLTPCLVLGRGFRGRRIEWRYFRFRQIQ